MSVFSSFLGSFGIVVTDLVPWLNGLTMVIILFTLYSLYLRRGFFFIPFYIGAVGGLLIFIYILFIPAYKYVLYIGNVLLIISAICNART